MTDCETSAVYCPVKATMDLLNGRWTLHILRELMAGRKRFNELQRALGPVSSRTLCARLRELEEQGLLTREIKNTIPPWVEYELTEKGCSLNAVIDSITCWGAVYMRDEIAACRATLRSPEVIAEAPPTVPVRPAVSPAGSLASEAPPAP
jgi:DNA-binding HxlR family transcriptional regulator